MNLGLNLAIGSRASSGGFNPAAALFGSGEQGYWLDPSDFSTMFQDAAGATPVTATGQSVRRWLDKSGRGNHFTQANVANAPVLQQDASGRYFLLFDGTDDLLQSAATINPGSVDKAQVFAGVRKLSDATGFPIIVEASANSGTSNGALVLCGNSGATVADYYGTSRGTALAATDTPNTFAAPHTAVVSLLADIAAPSVALRVNGAASSLNTATQGTGNFLTYTHYIGRRPGAGFPYNGRVYQLITRYGPNLTAAQITQTENFFNQCTGAF